MECKKRAEIIIVRDKHNNTARIEFFLLDENGNPEGVFHWNVRSSKRESLERIKLLDCRIINVHFVETKDSKRGGG